MAHKKVPTRQPVVGGKKSDAISLRVDPITRYALDLAARVTRRNISGVIEASIDDYFAKLLIPETEDSSGARSVKEVVSEIWSPNEVERLVMLGIRYPDLLDFDEKRRFKVINDTAELWESVYRREDSFRWKFAVEMWDQLGPMLSENAQKAVVKPLSIEQLLKLGIAANEDHPSIPPAQFLE